MEMASPGNQHCADCIGTLSFPINVTWSCENINFRKIRNTQKFKVNKNTCIFFQKLKQNIVKLSYNYVVEQQT